MIFTKDLISGKILKPSHRTFVSFITIFLKPFDRNLMAKTCIKMETYLTNDKYLFPFTFCKMASNTDGHAAIIIIPRIVNIRPEVAKAQDVQERRILTPFPLS